MRQEELDRLVKTSYEIVALQGSDAARVYHAIVELDMMLIKLKKRAETLDSELDE